MKIYFNPIRLKTKELQLKHTTLQFATRKLRIFFRYFVLKFTLNAIVIVSQVTNTSTLITTLDTYFACLFECN